MSLNTALELFGGLGLFLYGIKVMSDGLQAVSGDSLRRFLRKITNNRISGVFTGILVTTVIQSSSATTVMLVSFVTAGLFNLTQAIGVIMGANIGTTITGWLVALIGFKVKIAALALPAVGIGFFIRFVKNGKFQDWGFVLLGFGLLFLGLGFMKDSVQELRNNPAIVGYLSTLHVTGLGTFWVAVVVGTLVTVVVQSSSATMALTMTLALQGMIDFPTAAALILGENIGTTVTANIAAFGTTVEAKRTARAHFLFNLSGVLWMMCVFWWMLDLVDLIVPGKALSGDPEAMAKATPDHMAAFHTMFNVLNTLIFLPFVGFLAKVATKMVPESKSEARPPRLQTITTEVVWTASLRIEEVRQKLYYMSQLTVHMVDGVVALLQNPEEEFVERCKEIQAMELEVDQLEEDITRFSVALQQRHLSPDISSENSAIVASVSDVERIGDHCENILVLVKRVVEENIQFSDEDFESIFNIYDAVRRMMDLVYSAIREPRPDLLKKARVLENGINRLRTELRADNLVKMQDGSRRIIAGIIYVDLLTSFEKMGDHIFNIAEDFALMPDS
ncbi:MAG: Na/Pi cotransporter family protein [Planctomycetota bacterium]